MTLCHLHKQIRRKILKSQPIKGKRTGKDDKSSWNQWKKKRKWVSHKTLLTMNRRVTLKPSTDEKLFGISVFQREELLTRMYF
jgi:hypothetical protein